MEQEAEAERQRLKELVEGIKRKRQEIYAQAEEKARKSVQALEAEPRDGCARKEEKKSAFIFIPERSMSVKREVLSVS